MTYINKNIEIEEHPFIRKITRETEKTIYYKPSPFNSNSFDNNIIYIALNNCIIYFYFV